MAGVLLAVPPLVIYRSVFSVAEFACVEYWQLWFELAGDPAEIQSKPPHSFPSTIDC